MRVSILLCFVFFILSHIAFSQTSQKIYAIQFSDKGNFYSINNPEAFLSEKAILRRQKQGISIKNNDLPISPEYLQNIKNTGAKIRSASKWLNTISVEIENENQLNAIQQLNFIKKIEQLKSKPNSLSQNKFLEEIKPNSLPTNAMSSRANLNYGWSDIQNYMIVVHHLHNYNYWGQGMLIAVLDAGFTNTETHPLFNNLRNESRIVSTRNFVDGNSFVYDFSSHGTFVLSTMAADSPNEMIGTAPKASYALFRTEDAASEYIQEEYFWAMGAELADSIGADVINSSLGYTEFDNPNENHTYADLDGNTTPVTIAADIAASKGILVVNSAGNAGQSNWKYVGAPADGDSVLAIGAVNAFEEIAGFSSNGPSFDGRVKPNVCAMGNNTVIADLPTGIRTGNGTSFSGPIIAGAAAALWQAFPNKNNMEIFRAIEQSAHKYNNPDDFYGYGIPDFALASFILEGTVNVNDQNKKLQFSIYPNPNNGVFSINNPSPKAEMSVYDNSGKLIQHILLTEGIKQLSFKNLPKGIYIVQIKNENGIHNQKLLLLE